LLIGVHGANKIEAMEYARHAERIGGVLERRTGFVLQKEILRRRGIFRNTLLRNRRRFNRGEPGLRELDAIMEMLRPHFRL
jgi:hypothetical protein